MPIQKNISLAEHSTMRLGGMAAYAAEVHNRRELTDTLTWAETNRLPVIMIGEGSNIVWRDEGFNGLLLINKVLGYEVFEEDKENYYITVGAGEHWDDVVERTTLAGVSGIEAMSLIPGSAGATLVQNVGAYGQEISQTLVSVEAYDLKTGSFITIPNLDCSLGYRTSRFKAPDHGRFMLMGMTLHLSRNQMSPPFYPSLEKYLDDHSIKTYEPSVIRYAVIAIRSSHLPDPNINANCGSFFANPIIDRVQLSELLDRYPNLAYWYQDEDNIKISAGWLVENAGFKDFHSQETGMATWPAQAMVLVNEHARTTADLLVFRKLITDTVKKKFDIQLEQEPELLP
ncbi:MAG TPA: UDP-N-acetylmuramate dehydrogenase [Candidatus Saccharimonadales bacterium]|jgi:UDP-N-acetylmuramate dehydrogenase|nr:UDP-N-acetylmuramate dehydrogenase [Candidatus Saccharimonadales bacterium]